VSGQTNAPEMDWIVATEIQRKAEGDPHAYPRGTAPGLAHLIERDRQRFAADASTPERVEAVSRAVRHELTEVEALTEYSERGASEICESVARASLAVLASMALDGVCDCQTPGDWHRVANDFQRAMFDERARADRIAANLRTAEHAEQELRDVKHAYEREVELADRRAAELDALIGAANAAIASNSLGNIQAFLVASAALAAPASTEESGS
jgi:hypothetical protein